MVRRLIAASWVLLLLATNSVALAQPLATLAHDCRCNDRICPCPQHHHQKPAAPPCHSPGGGLPTLERCHSDEQPVSASALCVLPRGAALRQPLRAEALTPARARRLPLLVRDISPPPPRSPLA